MKKTNIGYSIDHANNGTIILTKAFNKKASNPHNPEYGAMIKLRSDFPNYAFQMKEISTNEDKVTHAKLTYGEMEKHIRLRESDPTKMLQVFEIVKSGSSITKSRYAYVKKWFLETYPNYDSYKSILKKEETAENAKQAIAKLKGA